MPSAVLVNNKCYRCYEFDTLCQFKYGDIVLTGDSITFKDMDCIYNCKDLAICLFNGVLSSVLYSLLNVPKVTTSNDIHDGGMAGVS